MGTDGARGHGLRLDGGDAAPDQAGQKTQSASVALTAAVFITILLLTGLFENLAEATLGAIVIHAVWHLIDCEGIGRYWSVRSDDFWAGLAALLNVLVFDILTGLLIAIGVSFLLMLARVGRPRWAVLGRTHIEETDDIAFQAVDLHPDTETFPGLLIIRFDADLFFANANVFAETVRAAIASADPRPSVVLIDAESISDIESTVLMVLRDLRVELDKEDIELWAARRKTRVSEVTDRVVSVRPGHLYPTVRAAVAAFEARWGSVEGRPADTDEPEG